MFTGFTESSAKLILLDSNYERMKSENGKNNKKFSFFFSFSYQKIKKKIKEKKIKKKIQRKIFPLAYKLFSIISQVFFIQQMQKKKWIKRDIIYHHIE